MKRFAWPPWWLLFFVSLLPARELPVDGSVPGWLRYGKPLLFQRQDLFNYIDGAAELFLELGFRSLTVQRYQRQDDLLELEVYEMEDETAARALYLHKRGPGAPPAGLPERWLSDRYQLTVQRAHCFIQVNNLSGLAKLEPDMAALAQMLLSSLPPDQPLAVLDLLPAAGRVPGSELLVRGQFSLQRLVTLGEGDILSLAGLIYGAAADYVDEQGQRFTRLLVDYASELQAQAAWKHLLANLDPLLQILRQQDGVVVFRDFQKRFGLLRLSGGRFEALLGLAAEPH